MFFTWCEIMCISSEYIKFQIHRNKFWGVASVEICSRKIFFSESIFAKTLSSFKFQWNKPRFTLSWMNRDVFRTLSNIYDKVFLWNSERLKTFNYFHKVFSTFLVSALRKIPKFHLIFLCANFVETHSFRSFHSFRSLRKLSVSTKFPH